MHGLKKLNSMRLPEQVNNSRAIRTRKTLNGQKIPKENFRKKTLILPQLYREQGYNNLMRR